MAGTARTGNCVDGHIHRVPLFEQRAHPRVLPRARSSFKDWARQHDVDEVLSEFALAHFEGSATVAAYERDDLLEKQRPVMRWVDYIAGIRSA